MTDDEPSACVYQTGGTYETPPEYCDLDAEPDSEYCTLHGERVAKLEALIQFDEFILTVETDPR